MSLSVLYRADPIRVLSVAPTMATVEKRNRGSSRCTGYLPGARPNRRPGLNMSSRAAKGEGRSNNALREHPRERVSGGRAVDLRIAMLAARRPDGSPLRRPLQADADRAVGPATMIPDAEGSRDGEREDWLRPGERSEPVLRDPRHGAAAG